MIQSPACFRHVFNVLASLRTARLLAVAGCLAAASLGGLDLSDAQAETVAVESQVTFSQALAPSYQTVSEIGYREGDTDGMTDEQAEYALSRCKLDVYYPEHLKNFPTVVWFHAGGITGGGKFIPNELKDQGVAVVAVNYRLSPKAKAPAYIEDTAAAVAWTMKHIAEYGGDPNKIVLSGHSAGGYLIDMVALDKKYLAKYDLDPDTLAGVVPMSGHAITHFTVRAERGIPGEQPIIDDLAPLYHVRKDAPPFVIISGDRNLEMLGRYEETAYFWRMLKVCGHPNVEIHELPGLDHGAMPRGGFPILNDFLKKMFGVSEAKTAADAQ